ncbi:putative-tyrosine phosphatase [Leptolyngbyaceae cyanobacterium JSC-12]|nr:putative-tyrosine phosphatase [Leptolyngbyaceae cyanobacterium JSC-12]
MMLCARAILSKAHSLNANWFCGTINDTKLYRLMNATLGIKAIVSVMDDPSNLDLYKQAEIPYRWLPTKGGTAPSPEQVQELQSFVDKQNQLGNAVAVHCTSGNRRTGTMLAAYLIQSGMLYDDAMHVIQTANPNAELREAQTNFLQALAKQ